MIKDCNVPDNSILMYIGNNEKGVPIKVKTVIIVRDENPRML